MRTLKTSEAAALLSVSPNTLRSWERRFGYPKPMRSAGQHRLYSHGEIAALRDALASGLSISSAISVAQEGISSDARALLGALATFDTDRANRAMEEAISLRPLERAVETVLLPALDEVRTRHGVESARWAVSARWAGDWLRRGLHVVASTAPTISLLIADASRDEFDPDAAYVRTLELACAQAGCSLLCVPVQALESLPEVVRARAPRAMVIAGSHASDDEVARFAYGARRAGGAIPVALYRRGRRDAHGSGATILAPAPLAARSQLLDLVAPEEERRARAHLTVVEPPAAAGGGP
jgi:DNA-binding transcriptional MerR regulator